MFELVKAITLDAACGSAHGDAAVSAEHPLLLDWTMSPRQLPDTWLLEIMAQVAGPLAEAVDAGVSRTLRWALLAMIRRARFERSVALPAQIRVSARLRRRAGASVTVAVEADDGDGRCASAEVVMTMIEVSAELDQARIERLARLERWQRAWPRS
jgi:hypothetical protein